MKAEVGQQRSLLELTELDAELGRLAHRATHLAEQQQFEQLQGEHQAANDRLAVLQIALDDLDGQVAEVRGRDRRGAPTRGPRPRRCSTRGRRRQAAVRTAARTGDPAAAAGEARGFAARGHGAARGAAEPAGRAAGRIDELQNETAARAAGARRGHDGDRSNRGSRLLASATSWPLSGRRTAGALRAQRAGRYRRRRCCRAGGAGPAGSRSTAASCPGSPPPREDEVLRCPECGAILLRVKDFGQ